MEKDGFMDYEKIGSLILQIRKEKGMTQQSLADAMHISNKTVSKWERGLGCPDVSLWGTLSDVLGVDIRNALDGELSPNRLNTGNIHKVKFYLCPICQNVLISTGEVSLSCCSRTLAPLVPKPPMKGHDIHLSWMDTDCYVSFQHEMTKEHYILFVAYVKSDQIILNRLYPEQMAETRLPVIGRTGSLYFYCSRHGLQVVSVAGLLKSKQR